MSSTDSKLLEWRDLISRFSGLTSFWRHYSRYLERVQAREARNAEQSGDGQSAGARAAVQAEPYESEV
jgi:hypothetical protein